MVRAIDLDKAIEIIEEKQKELCPVGSYGRHYVYGSDREKYDAWEEIIDALDALPTLTPPNEPLTLDSRLTPKMVTCPKGWKGVRYTRFHCPGCKKVLKKGEAYCHKCGQALIFPAARYDKENNRIWLDFSDRRPPEGEEDT